MPRPRRAAQPKDVIAITHPDDARRNIPTAELEPVMADADRLPVRVAYERRNRDLDPQLVWRGKDEQDDRDLVIAAPLLFTQEKVHPKVLVDDLMRLSRQGRPDDATQLDLFADFNGLHDPDARAEFYQHDQNWTNRMILGDSLQVMASLAEREELRGKVQCVYLDPPYGIKFNSNFQWSTTSRDVRDGNIAHVTREPEQVKAFRDTWRDGIHSYLSYLRDRLTVARDLLADSGSVFVQIGDENVHRVRVLMDEVFGDDNFVSLITIRKTTSEGASLLGSTTDFIIWYGKDVGQTKFRSMYQPRSDSAENRYSQTYIDGRRYRLDNITSSRPAGSGDVRSFSWSGRDFDPGAGTFKTTAEGLNRLTLADRLHASGRGKLNYRRFQDDFRVSIIGNLWADISGAVQSRSDPKVYVVQTSTQLIERCILMTTDPGDLVLDPTCGSGTTAYVAEEWGRRWITIDTSRVALALTRARVMGARHPWYLLADSPEGQRKEAEISHREFTEAPTYGSIRQGFVYERVPHVTLRDIANNAEIDVIWETAQKELEPLREELNAALSRDYEEWEVPRKPSDPWPESAAAAWLVASAPGNTDADRATALQVLNTELGRNYTQDDVPGESRDPWEPVATDLHRRWWERRIARQREIDASIAAKAGFEYLYDKPYEDRSKVRVAGPFTVESVSPHRVIAADDGEGHIAETGDGDLPERDFAGMILDNLRTSGVQQSQKADKIDFTAVTGWPGEYVCAEGRFMEGETERRAGIFIGPEFGTVQRADLIAAAREAAEAGFHAIIACAFSYDAHASELSRIGALPVLKARMNSDLHMAEDLKNDSKGNLFVIFGEPGHRAAGGRPRARRRGYGAGENQRRGHFRSRHRPSTQRRHRRHRLLVRGHQLQRRELLRPPGLLPRRQQRPLQGSQDHAESGDRRGSLGHSEPRRIPPFPQAGVGPHSRQGNQPPRRRGDEGPPGINPRESL